MVTADRPAPRPTAPDRDPSPRLWTPAEFARMQHLDAFAGRDVDLVGAAGVHAHGVLRAERRPVLPRPAGTTDRRGRLLQLPLDLGLISEPHPDVTMVGGSPRDYLTAHPKTALLVIEVSDTTIQDDAHDKAGLYASVGAHGRDETVTPLAAPTAHLLASDLLT